MIRRADTKDIENIIKLHLRSFDKNHFSTTFSKNLLKKYFNELIKMNEYCFVYYCTETEQLLGYIIAGFNTDEVVKKFTKDNLFSIVIILLKNPSFILEKANDLYEQMFGKDFIKKAKCRLYLIAVEKKYKGKGIGAKITKYLEHELKQNGIDEYGLSVRKENINAISFYNKCHYIPEFENSKSIYYLKNI